MDETASNQSIAVIGGCLTKHFCNYFDDKYFNLTAVIDIMPSSIKYVLSAVDSNNSA